MKIAISNIAWNPEEDKDILFLLKKYAIPAIEIAPTMIWNEPTVESTQSIKKYRKFWNEEGISIVSTQALLFGHPELKIFESKESRRATLSYIEKMIKICAILGVRDIIFGSPSNRDRRKLSMKQTLDIAIEFFYNVGELSKKQNIFFCIEPIPKENGNNFINNTDEGVDLVKRVNHEHFKLHLDSGALTINKENYQTAIHQAFPVLKHFHISDRNLLQIGTTDVDHKKIASILKNMNFKNWLSVEMKRRENESNTQIVEETLKYVTAIYA